MTGMKLTMFNIVISKKKKKNLTSINVGTPPVPSEYQNCSS